MAAAKQRTPLEEILIHLLFIIISIAMLIPFLLVISISFTSEHSLLIKGYRLIPDVFSLDAYKYILRSPTILLRAYGVTTIVTVVGTATNLMLTSMAAYAISRRDYAYRQWTTVYFFFTMLFGGGLVPFYILMTQYLHLKDTIWALIVPGLLNPFNLLMLRVFMQSIPGEIIESAKMDGAWEFRIFFTIILPLSTPGLATLGLFISFGFWNEWFNAMLFINNDKLIPLQLLLVRMMNRIEFLRTNREFLGGLHINVSEFPSLTARMAMAILVAGPMMFIFPFFQRYFIKGLTIGSLKG